MINPGQWKEAINTMCIELKRNVNILCKKNPILQLIHWRRIMKEFFYTSHIVCLVSLHETTFFFSFDNCCYCGKLSTTRSKTVGAENA